MGGASYLKRGVGLRRRDWLGLAIVLAAAAGFIAYRAVYIEPRAWGAICATAGAPMACAQRAGLIWLQRMYLWGAGSLAFGLFGFAWGGGFAAQIIAIVLGIGAIENYNATWGAVGLALGFWGWLGRPARAASSSRYRAETSQS